MKHLLKTIFLNSSLLLSSFDALGAVDYLSPPVDYPCTEECDSMRGSPFNVTVDALYWVSCQEGLNHLMSVGATVGDDLVFNCKPFHFKWRPGFRLGIGYDLEPTSFCSDWGAAVIWTHFQNTADVHATQPVDPTFNVTDAPAPQSAHWDFLYNVFDGVLIGPKFCLGSRFSWNPLIGVRSALIKEGISANPFNTDVAQSYKAHSRFFGVGPEVGFHSTYCLGHGFSLYGDAAAAILYGHFKVNVTNIDIDSAASLNDLYTMHVGQCVADFSIGLKWEHHLCIGAYEKEIELKLGWDHAQWFNFDQIGEYHARPSFQGGGAGLTTDFIAKAHGDLALDGLTLSAQFKF